jgi:hypothetical protein
MTRKQLKKMMIGLALATACAGFITACGSDEPSTPQGTVIKGPVVGATVVDSLGTVVTTGTDGSGKFPLTGAGPYTVIANSGTYFPIKIVGGVSVYDTTSPLKNPKLQSYNGYPQITPLTTLVQKLAATDAVAAKTLADSMKANGYDVTVDISSKNATNAAVFGVSEIYGAAMQTANGSAAYETVLSVLSKTLTSLPPAATVLAQATPAAAATLVSNAITAAITLNQNGLTAAQVATLNAAVVAEALAVATLPTTTAPPVVTGSTGSTGATSGTGNGF